MVSKLQTLEDISFQLKLVTIQRLQRQEVILLTFLVNFKSPNYAKQPPRCGQMMIIIITIA